jgi:hypothetical protein
MMMKADTILNLFLMENFPNNCSSLLSKCADWEIFRKFRTKEIFWNINATSITSDNRKCLWDKLINLRTSFVLKSKKVGKI